MLKWKGSLHLSFFIFLEILPENHVFYRDDVPSFLSPFESRFSRRMVSETELIVAGLTSRKRVKLETFETFSNIGETIRIRDKNYS